MKTAFLIIATILLSSFLTQVKDSQIKQAKWLLGTWEMKTKRGSVYESWEEKGAKDYSGMSYMINGGDTSILERIRLIEEMDAIYYIPAVTNQNDGKEIRFKATSITDSEMLFENPNHDFPQKIKYTLITEDSLVALASAEVNGEIKRQVFPMRRL